MIDDEFPEPHMGVLPKGRSPVQVAIDECGGVNSQDKAANYPLLNQLDYIAKMETRINSLVGMLRELELITDREDCTIRYCPVCSEYTEYPFNTAAHNPDCRLNKLLTSK